VFLPRSARAPEPAPTNPGPGVPASGRDSVLLVEDNEDVARAMESMLVAAGYRLTVVGGAAAALAAIDAGEVFDVVLCDIMMAGGMSGLEVAPLIRGRRPGLPVVLMTGYSDALAKGTACSFPVLSKPFGVEQFAAALRSAQNIDAWGVPARGAPIHT
jgi:CheY-like chemotaxis protein